MHSDQIPDLAPGRGALSSPVAGVSSGAKSRPGPGPGEEGQPGQPGGHLEPGLALLPQVSWDAHTPLSSASWGSPGQAQAGLVEG